MIDRVVVAIPRGATDPAADARRIEALGFAGAYLAHDDEAVWLLALGATLTLPLVGSTDLHARLSGHGHLAARLRDRVQPVGAGDMPVNLDVVDAAAARSLLAHFLSQAPRVIVALSGTHAADCRRLALDVLAETPPAPTEDGLWYADDLHPGQTFVLGSHRLGAEEIVAFAERYDPLDFHLDADLATSSPLGVLCASGIQTQAVMQRLNARGFHRNLAIVAGRGMRGMRLHRPTTPGLHLVGRTEVLEVHPRPTGRAVVVVRSTLHSGGHLVLEQVGEIVVRQR